MAEKRDYYDILGINKSASKDEIKSSYRKLAKKYHPDNKDTGDELKFKEVQEAYDVLYDDQKRATYDQFGHAAFDQNGGNPGGNPFGGGFSGFSEAGDIFGDIFSSMFGGGRSSRTNAGPTRGNDTIVRVKVDFMDAILGRDITLNLDIDETCSSCHGTGGKNPDSVKTCPHCNGRGYVRVQKRSIFGMVESQETCPHCLGKGKIVTDKCPDCGGKGYKRVKKEIPVHILAGIKSGQQVRIGGLGERGSNGGPNGDLFVEVIVKPHPLFKREGNDIHLDMPIDFVDACLGCKVDVPTVYGEMSLTIPAGTQPNHVLKMKGQGVKDLRTGKPGDQYIHLDIKMPTSLSKKEKQLLEEYRNQTSPNDSTINKFIKKFKK